MTASSFRHDINTLRALSVVLVVAYHFDVPLFGGGFIGVDLFFVISGFLMTQILLRQLAAGQVRYGSFLMARVRRIVPALLVVVGTTLAIGLAALAPLDARLLGREALAAVGFVSNLVYANQRGYFQLTNIYNWLLHTWSLSVEWQFYMLYPLLFLAIGPLARGAAPGAPATGPAAVPAQRRWLVGGVVVLAAASLAADLLWMARGNTNAAFYLLPARAWEMLAGGAAALCPLAPRWRRTAAWLGWSAIVLTAVLADQRHWAAWWPDRKALLPVLGAALVIAAGRGEHPLHRWRPVHLAGAWSYSLYLWHWPLAVWLRYHLGSAAMPLRWSVPTMVVAVVLAGLTHRFVENRFRRGVPAADRVRLPLMVGSGCAVALLAAAASWSNGFEAWHGERSAFYRSLRVSVDAPWLPPACKTDQTDPAPSHLCPIRRPGARRHVLVIGDSYAQQLYPWFDRFSAADVDFFVRGGCPAVPGFRRADLPVCSRYVAAAWQRAAMAEYDTVVIASIWSATHPSSSGYAIELCQTQPSGDCVSVGKLADRLAGVHALAPAIEGLLAQGKRVVVVDAHQRPDGDVPFALGREMAHTGRSSQSIDATHNMFKNADVDALFERLQAHPKFSVVSFRRAVCAQGRCPLYSAALGTPVFRDDGHFDTTWLLAHGDALKPFVTAERD